MLRRFLPFVTALLLSVVVLFTPESGVPSAPPGTDKVVHTLLFALLTATGLVARVPRVLLWLVAYAGVSEVLQELVTPLHRSGDWLDALVDVLGIALGLAIITTTRTRRARKTSASTTNS